MRFSCARLASKVIYCGTVYVHLSSFLFGFSFLMVFPYFFHFGFVIPKGINVWL